AIANADLLNDYHSPDGQWIPIVVTPRIANPRPALMVLHAAATLEPHAIVAGGELISSSPTFAPDSRSMAAVSSIPASLLGQWIGREPYDHCVQLWDVPTGRLLASFSDSLKYVYAPDGQTLITWDGVINLWDIPPRRPWWIEYGLPLVFAVLVLLAVRLVWRAVRKPPGSEAASC